MRRTQIYIDEKFYRLLKKESKTTGKTMSELIRESIKNRMNRRVEEILRRTEAVYGIWKDRKFDVEEYIRELRRDRNL
ncbi:MAG: ribbon-helix-helix protein, CopG family [Candidatus Dadabacteria bacterium CSP1-2]|nr:MAG: ribbon-helix-helix protein, CopG family [Candidatus Dadabacteria bacterium CSP1-2]